MGGVGGGWAAAGVYSHTHSASCSTCLSAHWSHDRPWTPGLQAHRPLSPSHSGCSDPHPEQPQGEHSPPGTAGLP